MDDLNQARAQAKEKMLDTLLEYVGAHHAEAAAQILDKAEEKTEWDIPPQLDRRMERLFALYRQKESFSWIRKKTGRVLGKVAVIFLVLGGSLVLLTSVSQAAKVKVFNFILRLSLGYEFDLFYLLKIFGMENSLVLLGLIVTPCDKNSTIKLRVNALDKKIRIKKLSKII